MNATLAFACLVGCAVLAFVGGLIRARLAARYIARIYAENGQLFTASLPQRTAKAARLQAWDRAHGLGRQCSPPIRDWSDFRLDVEKV